MNRKHNPLVAVAAMVLLATILVLICAGCSNKTTDTPTRFTVEEATNNGKSNQRTLIITDTETGAQYLYFKSNNSGGLVALQPGEG